MAHRRGARHEVHEAASGSSLRSGRELERERVAEIQRERMLGAMVKLTRERGAERVTVAHVVARAGVSRRTFYEIFADREACLLAALELGLERVEQAVVPAYRAEHGWCERIRAGLTALLEIFDEEPETAALCVVDTQGAGPGALERRAQVIDKLVDAVDRGRREARTVPSRAPSMERGSDSLGAQASPRPQASQVRDEQRATAWSGPVGASRITAEGVVGAVLAVLHARLLAESPKPLMPLRGQLMSMIVLPYLGAGAAKAESTRRAPPVRRAKPGNEDPLRGLNMRLTYRTMRVLTAIGAGTGLSNRHVSRDAGVEDQGQISKLLQRLESLGLIQNRGEGVKRGEPNAWVLSARGMELEQAIRARTSGPAI